MASLEPDTAADDEGLDVASVEESTESLRSSILHHRQEHGRTYHRYKEGKYNFPNDNIENERLDMQHHLFYLTYDWKLGLGPPNEKEAKVSRVLDLGTGTGIWAMDYADEHPEAEVIGVDLSPIQPNFVPPNVVFQVDDLEEPWTFNRKFDYIHGRMLSGSFANWEAILQKCYDNLEPGGWVEIQDPQLPYEADDSTLKGTQLDHWGQTLAQAVAALGRPFMDARGNKAAMERIGFEDVHERLDRWPVNQWPRDKYQKEIASWTAANVNSGLEGFSLAPLTRGLGWSAEQVRVLLVDVRKDLRNRAIHAYVPIWTTWGRKPGGKKEE